MEGLTLNSVPFWLVGAAMLYTGLVWLVSRKHAIRMDSRIVGFTLLLQGVSYLLSNITYDSPTDLQRILGLRMNVILICLAQSLPMTVSYLRTLRRERELNGEKG